MCQVPNTDQNLISNLCVEEVASPSFESICGSVSCCYMERDMLAYCGFDTLKNAFLE